VRPFLFMRMFSIRSQRDQDSDVISITNYDVSV
jgi:hypothetical protein